ncbi:hypothetical protein Hypma_009853 [Hypsizygus marmoreus]|uniref:Uncharacterized protein n=1 Tax=Hypsizygus marmoreus TaxID=39966 RepID=A0A369JLF1_HYPMA|nr:hypothetical protein Hypma_009853 [Hypsizygus marmoreus]
MRSWSTWIQDTTVDEDRIPCIRKTTNTEEVDYEEYPFGPYYDRMMMQEFHFYEPVPTPPGYISNQQNSAYPPLTCSTFIWHKCSKVDKAPSPTCLPLMETPNLLSPAKGSTDNLSPPTVASLTESPRPSLHQQDDDAISLGLGEGEPTPIDVDLPEPTGLLPTEPRMKNCSSNPGL